MIISTHQCHDWCHLCGLRTEALVDIRYSKNAEHYKDESKYIRICGDCGEVIARIAKAPSHQQVTRVTGHPAEAQAN